MAPALGPGARAPGLLHAATGMVVRADPRETAFPNADLTAHLHGEPRGPWVGFDTTVTFGPTGAGLMVSTLHDESGPFGVLAQSLVVRSRVQHPSRGPVTGAS